MPLTTLDILISLVKEFEGCKLTAYRCPAGVLTIGYGHTGKDVYQGMKISQDQANNFLHDDAMEALDNASESSKCLSNVSHEKHAAIADFIFNCGLDAYEHSTLKKYVDSLQWPKASEEIKKWNHVNGKELDGLTRRRKRESDMLLS